jgi:hypothetical protein
MEFKILSLLLRHLADNIDSGNSNITEAEMLEICELISNSSNPEEKISKYQTADLLGVNHKTVDYYVRKGYIPHGKQEIGFKEIFWCKKDILKFKEEKDSKKKKNGKLN